MYALVVIFACLGAVLCNDLEIGNKSGRIIFDEKIEASPAIWKQTQNVTVNTTADEVISWIKVVDERDLKDGSAKFMDGGLGQKHVTIELQSPAVFRGFTFHVVVYAIQEKIGQNPISVTKDTEVNQSATTTKDDVTDSVSTVQTSQKPAEGAQIPIHVGNQDRKNRDTQDVIDPIVQYVNKDNVQETTEEPTVQIPAKESHPHDLVSENDSATTQTEASTTDATTAYTDIQKTKVEEIKPQTEGQDFNGYIYPTVKPAKIDEHAQNTEKLASEDNENTQQTENIGKLTEQQDFESISKDIDQKVVYGIKH